MPERQLVAPPPGIDIEPLFMEVYRGHYGLTGTEITVFERPGASANCPAELFKGGWGDAGAISCMPLAMMSAYETGRAATVGNIRLSLLNPLTLAAFLNTPVIRSQALHAGMEIVMELGSEDVTMFGQSHGGLDAVRAATHTVTKLPKGERPQQLSVFAMDSPGMYGNLPKEHGLLGSMGGLLTGMLQDFRDTPEPGKWLFKEMCRHQSFERMTRELGYFVSEFIGLLNVDESKNVAILKGEKIPLGLIFHSKDVVPHPDDPNALLLDGHHAAGLLRPKPVIDFMAARRRLRGNSRRRSSTVPSAKKAA